MAQSLIWKRLRRWSVNRRDDGQWTQTKDSWKTALRLSIWTCGQSLFFFVKKYANWSCLVLHSMCMYFFMLSFSNCPGDSLLEKWKQHTHLTPTQKQKAKFDHYLTHWKVYTKVCNGNLCHWASLCKSLWNWRRGDRVGMCLLFSAELGKQLI